MHMLKRATRPREDERGAVAILVAASLLMLMGFAAMTVDVGAAFGERRQDQSASDMAAMVAVQFAQADTPGEASTNGETEAKRIANANLSTTVSDAQWGSCWDPEPLAIVSSISPCISFSYNLQRARVVIPTVEVETTFGRVLGVDSISVSAFAEAQGDLAQEGKVLPFGLFAGNAGATEICLKTSSGGHVPPTGPCAQNEDGNFGTLGISLYGNPTVGTRTACEPSHAQDALAANIAAGVDHPLGIFSSTVRNDGVFCSGGPVFNARPNEIMGETGKGSNLYAGMIEGVGPNSVLDRRVDGRLNRGVTIPVDSNSPGVNDTGLWTYIASSGDRPSSCNGNTNADMAACISAWRGGTYSDPLFDITIEGAARFGAVPILEGSSWGHGKKPYRITGIVPVYIQSTWWECKTGGCTVVHAPGDSGPGTDQACPGWQETSCGLGSDAKGKLEFVTAFVLDVEMLPEPLRSSFPSTAGQVDYALVK